MFSFFLFFLQAIFRFYSSKSLLKNEEERRRNEQSEFLAVEQGGTFF